jgi:enoyl-CoA hydratase/carnithine racemase
VPDDLETLLYEERGPVAIVTMNRPEVQNCFNFRMQQELKQVWTSLRTNDDIRAAILTGAGDEAFCTGIDRAEQVETYLTDDPRPAFGRVASPFQFNSVGPYINPKANDLWKPVVAAVNGMACAGALYMLGEVDIIVAAEHATFFDPHVSYGMVSGFEAVHLLQKLPLGETLRVALLGLHERMSARRAFDVGLVSEVVPADELLDRALWVANAIAASPPLAVQASLRAIWMAHESLRRQALDLVSTFVTAGSDKANIAAGQALFKGDDRPEWQVR